MTIDLHLPEAAGWRGLLTQAQQSMGAFLPEAVEEYVVRLLYRMLGSAHAEAIAAKKESLYDWTRARARDMVKRVFAE